MSDSGSFWSTSYGRLLLFCTIPVYLGPLTEYLAAHLHGASVVYGTDVALRAAMLIPVFQQFAVIMLIISALMALIQRWQAFAVHALIAAGVLLLSCIVGKWLGEVVRTAASASGRVGF